jgi:hypothetical protein
VQEDKNSEELSIQKVEVKISIVTKKVNDLKNRFKDLRGMMHLHSFLYISF